MMKHSLFAILFFLAGCFMAVAQTPSSPGKIPHYTYGDLDKLNKLDLTLIYIQQIQKLNQLLPYSAFNQKGEAASLEQIGIPGSKDNNSNVKKLDASIASHNEILLQSMSDIIPYADKPEIIQGVLFIQGIIERLEAGF